MDNKNMNNLEELKMHLQKNMDFTETEKKKRAFADFITMLVDDNGKIVSDPEDIEKMFKKKNADYYIYTNEDDEPFHVVIDDGEISCSEDVLEEDLEMKKRPRLDPKLKDAKGRLEVEENIARNYRKSSDKAEMFNKEAIKLSDPLKNYSEKGLSELVEPVKPVKPDLSALQKPQELGFFSKAWDSICSIFSKGSAKGIEYRRAKEQYDREKTAAQEKYDKELEEYELALEEYNAKKEAFEDIKETSEDLDKLKKLDPAYAAHLANHARAKEDYAKVKEFEHKDTLYNSQINARINALTSINKNGFTRDNIGPYYSLLADNLKGQKITDKNVDLYAQFVVLTPYATSNIPLNDLTSKFGKMIEDVKINPFYKEIIDKHREKPIGDNAQSMTEEIKKASLLNGMKHTYNELMSTKRELENNLQSSPITEQSAIDLARLYYISKRIKEVPTSDKSYQYLNAEKEVNKETLSYCNGNVRYIKEIAESQEMKDTIQMFAGKKLPISAVVDTLSSNVNASNKKEEYLGL